MIRTDQFSCHCCFFPVHGAVVPGGGGLGSGTDPGGQGRAEGGVAGIEESKAGVESQHRWDQVSGEVERSVSQPPPTACRCQQPATTLFWYELLYKHILCHLPFTSYNSVISFIYFFIFYYTDRMLELIRSSVMQFGVYISAALIHLYPTTR